MRIKAKNELMTPESLSSYKDIREVLAAHWADWDDMSSIIDAVLKKYDIAVSDCANLLGLRDAFLALDPGLHRQFKTTLLLDKKITQYTDPKIREIKKQNLILHELGHLVLMHQPYYAAYKNPKIGLALGLSQIIKSYKPVNYERDAELFCSAIKFFPESTYNPHSPPFLEHFFSNY